jgi:hypothetical protein
MMLLVLPLIRRNVSSRTPALTRLAFLLARRDLKQAHRVSVLKQLALCNSSLQRGSGASYPTSVRTRALPP